MYYYKLLKSIIIIIFLNLIILKNNFSKTNYNNIFNNNIKKNFSNNIYIKNNKILIKINKNNSKIKKIYIIKYDKNIKLNNKKNNYNILTNIKLNNKNNVKFKIKKVKFIKNNIILISKRKINNLIYIENIKINKNLYNINYKYILINKTNKIKKINLTNKIIKKNKIYNNDINIAYHTYDKLYKFNINNIYNKIKKNIYLYWISIYEKYYLLSWIENIPIYKKITINKINNNILIKNKKIYTLYPYKKKIINLKLLISPKLNNYLNNISKNLDSIIEFGYLNIINKYLFNLLNKINLIVNNWGYSIIILTILFKIITYPLNKIQYLSLLKIKKIQYKIKKIKNKYNNNNLINKKIINLYKKYNINPFINLLITIIQIPILISMYNILTIPIELKKSNFILWIKDLSTYDKYYILPILMSISLYLTYDNDIINQNNKIKNYNIITSILIGIFSIHFPSGVLLYYIINNITTLIQQKIIKKLSNNNEKL